MFDVLQDHDDQIRPDDNDDENDNIFIKLYKKKKASAM